MNGEQNKKENTEIERIRNIIEGCMVSFHNYQYSRYIESYKKYIGFVCDRLEGLDTWKNNMVFPIVTSMADTINSTVFDFDYKISLKSSNMTKACEDAFDFQGFGKEALRYAGKEAIITGDGILRDMLFKDVEKYDLLGDEIETTVMNPSMKYASVFNVMYDRMRGLNNSPYTIMRQFKTFNEIESSLQVLSDKDKKIAQKKIKDMKGKECDQNNSFSFYNYESIKALIFTYKFYSQIKEDKQTGKTKGVYKTSLDTVKKCCDLNPNKCEDTNCKNSLKESMYVNDFDEKFEVIHFTEGNKKYLFVNGNHILTENIQPGILRLRGIAFSDVAGPGTSRGVGEILGPIQDAATALINMFLDGAKLANTKMFSKKGGAIGAKQGTVKIESGAVHYGELGVMNLGHADFSTVNGIQMLQQFGQSLLGINQMIIGGDSRVQRVAGAFDFAFKQYKTRLTPFTDTINVAMGKIVKSWVIQYLHYYTEEELTSLYKMTFTKEFEEKIVNKKKVKVMTDLKVDGVSIHEIINENNISFNYDSMFNLRKEAEKKTMIDIYQTAKQYNGDQVDDKAFVRALAGDMNVNFEDALGIGGINIDDGLEVTDTEQTEIDEFIAQEITPETQQQPTQEDNVDVQNIINNELL